MAGNAQEAKEQIFAEKPDLILLDIMMDSLSDGFSLCHAIKTSGEYAEFKDTPIIFVSAVKEIAGTRFQFKGDREQVRLQAVAEALKGVQRLITHG